MKTALITGGSKGIGLGIAEVLIANGWHVAITGRNKHSIDQAIGKLNTIKKDRALGLIADVRKLNEQQTAVETLLENWGQLDVLVANAGIGHFGSIEELSAEQWHETIDTNLTGVFYSIKASLPALKKSKGYIITMASLAGTNFFAGGSAYNASKFGLVGFTQAVMMDVRAHGIKVSTIMPGSVATYFNDHVPSPSDAWKIQPEDIGQLVLGLLTMNPRTLPSKIEVRPSMPPGK
ncbi:MAG: SDR family oxidoreductase [Cyclobacteriaceae bacterium]|nr:SDR family oxidoreductase [Cyclobacteriaceae bacterium]UYN85167.1 MAG: SDR family oxidoreductase [Cyclobacteriaceae bacterium]